jgi:hypothetical protein
MSTSEERLRKKKQREERLRKKTLRQRHQKFIQEDAARNVVRRENNDRQVIEKAAEQRLWDGVKAQVKKVKVRQEVVYVYSDEDSEEDSREDSEEDSEENFEEVTNRKPCLNLSCLVVLLLVSNLLSFLFIISRQV